MPDINIEVPAEETHVETEVKTEEKSITEQAAAIVNTAKDLAETMDKSNDVAHNMVQLQNMIFSAISEMEGRIMSHIDDVLSAVNVIAVNQVVAIADEEEEEKEEDEHKEEIEEKLEEEKEEVEQVVEEETKPERRKRSWL